MVNLFKQWLSHVFSSELVNIVKGNFNRLFRRKQYLFDSRYEICKQCSSKEDIKGLGEICKECGCPLQSKLRVKDEHCYLNKWK